jgi:hypothetical protein
MFAGSEADVQRMGAPGRPSTRLTGSRARSSARRRALHALLGVASWIALGALWAWQAAVHVPSHWLQAIALIAALAAAWACFATAWVAWCRNIYKRRHSRTNALLRHIDFERDTLGREVLAPPGLAELSGQVLISVPGPGMKLYQLGERIPRRAPQPLGEDVDSQRATAAERTALRGAKPLGEEDVDSHRATMAEHDERAGERREVA